MIYIISFLAGILTILAPCALPMIPVICGRWLESESRKRIFVILWSFVLSIIAFTLLLKISAVCAGIDNQVWKMISASILILFGLFMIFPFIWDTISIWTGITQSGSLLSKSKKIGWTLGDILLWASLGPVFSSCSPTYALIVAVILPASFLSGFLAMTTYALGIASMLLLVIRWGRGLIQRLQIVSSSDGWFKKFIGLIILLTWLAILTGFDKIVESKFVDLTGTSLINRESQLIHKAGLDKL